MPLEISPGSVSARGIDDLRAATNQTITNVRENNKTESTNFEAKPQLTRKEAAELRSRPTVEEDASAAQERRLERESLERPSTSSQNIRDALDSLGGVIDIEA